MIHAHIIWNLVNESRFFWKELLTSLLVFIWQPNWLCTSVCEAVWWAAAAGIPSLFHGLNIFVLAKDFWYDHWKPSVVMMPTSSSLVTPKAVIKTASGDTNDDRVGIMTPLCFSDRARGRGTVYHMVSQPCSSFKPGSLSTRLLFCQMALWRHGYF